MMKSNNSLTTYNEWFISAIKSSKVGGEVDEKKLLQHCLKCLSQVKSLLDSNEDNPLLKYEEFRLNSTILLLLACPIVSTCAEISSSEDLIPLIKSVPTIVDEKLFIVLKCLKNYRYLRGILPWLPAKVLAQLLSKFLDQSKSTTPLVLAFSFEMIFALTHSLQLEREEVDSLKSCLEAYTTFLNSIEVGFDSEQNCKLRAYHFLYIVESLYLLVCLMSQKEIEAGGTVSLGLKIQSLRNNLPKDMPSIFDLVIQEATNNLLAICKTVVHLITSDIWISWHDIKSPTFGLAFVSGTQKEPDNSTNSIQTQVAHTVFRILKGFEQLEESKNLLKRACYQELQVVFKHFASDPDYDPDVDLTIEQLIESIQDMSSARDKKLLKFLLEREDIFEMEECLKSISKFGGVLPKPIVIPFINRAIDKFIGGDNILEGWKRVVIEFCQKLPTENLLHFLKEKLNNGKNDCLKTSDFALDVTQVFNQLSDQPDNDKFNGFVWLCLQSGVDVVKSSLEMAISLPGLAPVVTPRLRTIHFICRTTDQRGVSLLTRTLVEILNRQDLTPENEREFLTVVLMLLATPQNQDSEDESEEDLEAEMALDIPELLDLVVLPRLNWAQESTGSLVLPLEILKSIADLYPATILKAGMRMSSTTVCLALIYHNCCGLTALNASFNLRIRTTVQFILRKLLAPLRDDEERFAKEISLVKVILTEFKLHPRCLRLLSPIVYAQDGPDSFPLDRVFSLIMEKNLSSPPQCSATQWIWILYTLLPDCNDEEWAASLHLTHVYLEGKQKESNLVMATLKLFRSLLYLLCSSVSNLGKEGSGRKETSLSHCFKCFSSAAMNFVMNQYKEDDKKFSHLNSLFRWWALAQRDFDCDPELPCLFLNSLCTSMSDLLKGKQMVIKRKSSKTAPSFQQINPHSERTGDVPEVVSHHSGSLVNGVLNHVDSLESQMTVKDPSCVHKLTNRETFTKEEFKEVMAFTIHIFVTSVTQSATASTVAGKLKALCELALENV